MSTLIGLCLGNLWLYFILLWNMKLLITYRSVVTQQTEDFGLNRTGGKFSNTNTMSGTSRRLFLN